MTHTVFTLVKFGITITCTKFYASVTPWETRLEGSVSVQVDENMVPALLSDFVVKTIEHTFGKEFAKTHRRMKDCTAAMCATGTVAAHFVALMDSPFVVRPR